MWLKLGAFLMFLGVALGAFGTHAFKSTLTPYDFEIYKTAVFYHLIHALGLFFVGWLASYINDPKLSWAGMLLIAGIILFSGSLYGFCLTGQKWLVAVTPLGGVAFLAAWLLLVFCG